MFRVESIRTPWIIVNHVTPPKFEGWTSKNNRKTSSNNQQGHTHMKAPSDHWSSEHLDLLSAPRYTLSMACAHFAPRCARRGCRSVHPPRPERLSWSHRSASLWSYPRSRWPVYPSGRPNAPTGGGDKRMPCCSGCCKHRFPYTHTHCHTHDLYVK